MPVVQRPRRPREPSGLEQFLQTLGVLSTTAGRVGTFLQGREQLGLQEEQLGLQREQQERNEAMSFLTQFLNQTTEARNETLQNIAAQGGEVDPALFMAAPTMGDNPFPEMRTRFKEVASNFLGIPAESISNNFILSPNALQEASERDITEVLQNLREFGRIQAQAGTEGLDIAAEEGELAVMSGQPGFSPAAAERRGAIQNTINELMRVEEDPETGELRVSGPAIQNSAQTINTLLGSLGEPLLPMEFDPSTYGLRGPSRIVASDTWNELTKFGIESAFQSDEAYRQSIRDAAQKMSEDFNMPFDDALAALEGRLGDMEVGNAEFVEKLRSYHRGVAEFLGSMDPATRALFTLGEVLAQELNIPAEDMLNSLDTFTTWLQDQDPHRPGLRNVGSINNFLRSLGLQEGPIGFEIAPGEQGERTQGPPDPQTQRNLPGGATGAGQATEPQGLGAGGAEQAGRRQSGEIQNEQMMRRALSFAMNQAVQWLQAFPPEQRRAQADSLLGVNTITGPEGNQFNIELTQEDITRMLEQAGTQ